MRSRLSGVLLGLMMMGLLLIPVTSASALVGYTISGTVVDSIGEPVANAYVQLWDSADENQVLVGGVGVAARSGADGSFTLGPVPNGSYIVELSDALSEWDSTDWWGYDFESPDLVQVNNASVTGLVVVDDRTVPDVGTGTITVLDDLTGLPIEGAYLESGIYDSNYTDLNGTAVMNETDGPVDIVAVGYLNYSYTGGVADGSTISVRMTLDDGWGVMRGLFVDESTDAPITRDPNSEPADRINAYVYTVDSESGEYVESAWCAGRADGTFSVALPAGDAFVEFVDDGFVYAGEWFKDSKFMSSASPVSVTSGSAVDIVAKLGVGTHISGAITSTGGWLAADPSERAADQWCEAWAFNDTTKTWELVAELGTDGSTYSLEGLPAGDYKVATSMVFGDSLKNPIIVNGMPLRGTAWYKQGAAVKFVSDDLDTDKMAKISQADTVTVGVGSPATGIDFVVSRLVSSVSRQDGSTRYDVAAKLARTGWNTGVETPWQGVEHIIIANGEDGKEADPLAAAGLAGVYDCPVLLVKTGSIPNATRYVITEIARANPGVEIHIIGGTGSVPINRWYDMRKISGVSTRYDQIGGANRYDVSVNIANRIMQYTDAESLPGVLIVAGDNAAAFYDALAASPISYANRMPMLCVRKASVPPSVGAFLSTEVDGVPRYVVNSTTYVSDTTKRYVGSVPARLATSGDRYTAATQIATAGMKNGWVSSGSAAIAAKLPDALTGGVFSGRNGGIMLFTDSTVTMKSTTKSYITAKKAGIYHGWIFGGTGSVPAAQETTFKALLK